jgi:LuxR family transcriptional regulator, maltose regulon positive regulatory protein
MALPILATKLYIPPPRPNVVARPRLIERLNAGHTAGRMPGVTLISAAAGFGKTTLVGEWVHQIKAEGGRMKDESVETVQPSAFSLHPFKVAWLSLDEGDRDPARFLTYLIAALQTIAPNIGKGVLGVLQSPQPPPASAILTAVLNDLATVPDPFVLVLDDYHVMGAKAVDEALAFLLEHLPPQMHLVIATREDPDLPLARLRARGQLTELRAAELRFTPAEAADFLNPVMGLNLSAADIAALENRTEGWIVGLQLAALSMQAYPDAAGFIQSFTGSHRFVLDYLVEEVLQQQPESVQNFLLRTSILDRLCGSLCDAVLGKDPAQSTAGLGEGGTLRVKDDGSAIGFTPPSVLRGWVLQPSAFILESIERANLFIIPLDNERRWYRYHHLFADLLRQRLQQSLAASGGDAESGLAELHIRASQWYEDHGLDIEAFQHAAAAHDIERAERLIQGKGIPLHLRGAVLAILDWLASLPAAVLNARPSLWWRYGSLLLVSGQTTGVEEKLQAAEDALPDAEPDHQTRNLIGRIAAARAVLALTRYQAETMLVQSRRALEYLDPDNLSLRANANWTLGYAYLFQGDRPAAGRALAEAIALSQASGDVFTSILATIGLGNLQEAGNQLQRAAETYQRVVQMAGDQPIQIVYEAHLGLARILCEWNDLAAAEQHGQQSLQLARQYDRVIDRFVVSEVFLARLKLAQGDVAGAAALLAEADQSARQQNFVFRIPEVAAALVLTLLRQGHVAAAAALAQTYPLPLSQARVYLAQGNPSAALAVLAPWRQQVEARGWEDERLKVLLLQALAHQAQGEKDQAVQLLAYALALAEPGGFVRIFVDEGAPVAELLTRLNDAAQPTAALRSHAQHAAGLSDGGSMRAYGHKLLAAFGMPADTHPSHLPTPQVRESVSHQPLIEPLSQRELEVLQLIAQGQSNHEISEQLFLALDTVKGHNRRIYDKLHVQRRTEAVARARELGLL